MKKWLELSLVAAGAAALALLLIFILRRCLKQKSRGRDVIAVADVERSRAMQSGIARLHQVSPHHHHLDQSKANYNYNQLVLFKRGVSTRTPLPFSWADHPSLVTDAVENGWSRFAFTAFAPSPSVKSARAVLLGACAAGDTGNDKNVEIGWEVCEGSADFVQKVRLKPNGKKASSSMAAAAVIRTALPLPGPNLGNSSFPQEAYFEITILYCNEERDEEKKKGKSEGGDKIKLISEDFNAKNSPDSSSNTISSHSQRRRSEGVSMAVGLTGGSTLPLRIPGSYPGSIGFYSSGTVFLDGTKLVLEPENKGWGTTDSIIGCGYNPGQRKVFFTVDSQIVHEIHCRTEDYGSPLYPTLAANTDVIVSVNLGQSPFKYIPANLQRTPNPCFIGPLGNSPSLGYDDSRELFSMGRIDSQWLQRNATAARSNNNTVNSLKALEYDQESEGDLFEIVLDSTGRSPYTTVQHQV